MCPMLGDNSVLYYNDYTALRVHHIYYIIDLRCVVCCAIMSTPSIQYSSPSTIILLFYEELNVAGHQIIAEEHISRRAFCHFGWKVIVQLNFSFLDSFGDSVVSSYRVRSPT